MPRWVKHKLESRLHSLRNADDTTLMAESKQRGTEEPLDEGGKAGLTLNKIMASGPIISWQIEGEKVETVTDVIFILKSLWMVTAAMKLKDTWPWKEMYDKPK